MAGCTARRDAVSQEETGAAVQGTTQATIKTSLSATVALAANERLQVFREPFGTPLVTLDNPLPSGAPLTLLVRQEAERWAEVLLPLRPNGSAGWVRLDDIHLASLSHRIDISLRERSMTVWDGTQLLLRTDVAIGAPSTPTPTGTFFLTELLGPLDPADGYGTYAYGTSAFSDVLDNFGSGPGVIGMHGTSDDRSIGKPVSHGCIRVPERHLRTLVPVLPLGTPFKVVP